MASTTTNTAIHFDLTGALRAVARDLADRWGAYRTYRDTRQELSTLSDRTLHDLGLNRSMVEQVARQSAGYML